MVMVRRMIEGWNWQEVEGFIALGLLPISLPYFSRPKV
jgi:hypothetical protein